MKYQLLIFDMDGTILDTLLDLHQSLNHALALGGYPTRSVPQVRAFVGNGLAKLVERGLPAGASAQVQQQTLAALKAHYQQHCRDNTRPYDGIRPLLETVRARGYRTAVVSNKADFAVQELAAEFFPGLFDIAVGDREGQRRKPAPDGVLRVLDTLGTAPEDAVYIGDSEVDLQTAQNAGLDCIAVSWGFRDRAFLEAAGARHIVDTPPELLRCICGKGGEAP